MCAGLTLRRPREVKLGCSVCTLAHGCLGSGPRFHRTPSSQEATPPHHSFSCLNGPLERHIVVCLKPEVDSVYQALSIPQSAPLQEELPFSAGGVESGKVRNAPWKKPQGCEGKTLIQPPGPPTSAVHTFPRLKIASAKTIRQSQRPLRHLHKLIPRQPRLSLRKKNKFPGFLSSIGPCCRVSPRSLTPAIMLCTPCSRDSPGSKGYLYYRSN